MTSPRDPGFDDVGFDISHNNGADLQFNVLFGAGGGRKVCHHKITEGTQFVDRMFVPNVTKILALDDLGQEKLAAYHFAHHGRGREQVEFFLEAVDKARAAISLPFELLYMLDLERSANPPDEDTAHEMVDALAAAGVPNPMIYCGYDFFTKRWPWLAPCSHFLAAYNARPKSAIPWRLPSATIFGFDFWQYTGDSLGPWARDIPGGSHGMDLSVFNTAKNAVGLDAWWTAELAKITRPRPA